MAPRLRAPRRTDFRLLWLASSVSALGSASTAVVLPLVAVVTLRASALAVGMLLAFGYCPWLLFGLPAGVWVDAIPRRALLIGSDLVRAVALATVPVAALAHALTFAQLLGVSFTSGVASVFAGIAEQSFVPQVVRESQLLSANSRLQGGEQVAAIAGPGVGGWAVQLFGGPLALLVDVASYLGSALCLWGIKYRDDRTAASASSISTVGRIRQGIGYLIRSRTLRPLAALAASFNLWAAGIGALQVPFLVRTVHLKPFVVGLLMSFEAPAALLGAMLAGRLTARLGSARTVMIAAVSGPACAVLMPLASPGAGMILFAAGAGGLALFTVVSSIVTRVYRQRAVPAEMLSRVTAVNRFLSWGMMPVGALLAGALSVALGIRAAFLFVAVAMVAVTPLPLLLSPMRKLRDFERIAAAAQPVTAESTYP